MSPKFYKTEEAAKLLGVTPAEVNHMRESLELHGYRDGMDWKFKAEEVDQLAQKRKAAGDRAEEDTDVLLSDAALGQSESGASGTVIGGSEGQPGDSDIQIGDSDIRIGDSDLKLSGSDSGKGGSDASDFEELDLALEEDLSLEDSKVPLTEAKKEGAEEEAKTGDSNLDLAEGEGLDDDDLVLGGSGSGSDITMGGDSGISLVDPADSGLSLEEPLELAPAGDETLELGEDDMISLSEEADLDSPTELKAEEEFTLTPMEEGGDEEDSESGSQVIALDEVEEAEPAAAVGRAPMLEEEFPAEPALGMDMVGAGAPLGAAAMGGQPDLAGGMPLGAVAALPETPYSVWNVLSLALCAILLAVAGMMMYDLVRNMWSWDSQNVVSSPLMDGILSLFGK